MSLFWLTSPWQRPHHFHIKLGIISNFMSSFRESRVLIELALQSDNSGSNTDSTPYWFIPLSKSFQPVGALAYSSVTQGSQGQPCSIIMRIKWDEVHRTSSTGPEILNEFKDFRFLLFKVERFLKICLIFNPSHGVSKSIWNCTSKLPQNNATYFEERIQ